MMLPTSYDYVTDRAASDCHGSGQGQERNVADTLGYFACCLFFHMALIISSKRIKAGKQGDSRKAFRDDAMTFVKLDEGEDRPGPSCDPIHGSGQRSERMEAKA